MAQKEQPGHGLFQAILTRLHRLFRVGYDDTDESTATGALDGIRQGNTGTNKTVTRAFIEYTYEHSKADFVVKTGMTPEEMILELVTENDGRMRQKELASLVGWSDATVSRLLQDMEDAKSLNRFRLGREKIICEPELAPSGFDEPMGIQASPTAVEEDTTIRSD